LRYAQNAEYEVVWLPMRDDVRNSSFNATKAWNFFKRVEGDPYGHDKAVFAWIDTENQNFFQPFSSQLLPFIIKYVEQIYPEEFISTLKNGLNMRLGVN